MNIYHQALIDHYKHSPHKKLLSACCFASAQYNPSCGDRVSFQGVVENGLIKDLAFQGSGCVISQATASLLCAHFIGKTLSAIDSFSTDDLLQLIGITLGPHRLRCALIAREALQQGAHSYRAEQQSC